MKIKTAELTGAALNWAVAMCEGWQWATARDNTGQYPWLVKVGKDIDPKNYRPSTSWMQGGPIIDREKITIAYGEEENDWFACVGDSRRFEHDTPDGIAKFVGATPLIAAMRCYVASKKGDEVDVPEEVTL